MQKQPKEESLFWLGSRGRVLSGQGSMACRQEIDWSHFSQMRRKQSQQVGSGEFVKTLFWFGLVWFCEIESFIGLKLN